MKAAAAVLKKVKKALIMMMMVMKKMELETMNSLVPKIFIRETKWKFMLATTNSMARHQVGSTTLKRPPKIEAKKISLMTKS
jgi:hypothetical protein